MNGRFLQSLKRHVLNLLAEEGPPPLWRTLEGRVVKCYTEGGETKVDVVFFDPSEKVKSKVGVLLYGSVGQSVTVVTGVSRVLVFWLAADERYARAMLLGSGELQDSSLQFQGAYTLKGPKINLGGQALECDRAVTAADLQALLQAISVSPNLPALALLLQSPPYGWTPKPPVLPGLGSGVVGVKR